MKFKISSNSFKVIETDEISYSDREDIDKTVTLLDKQNNTITIKCIKAKKT